MRTLIEATKPFRTRALTILVIAALVAAVVGCGTPDTMYSLTIGSTEGGVVIAPGEGTSEYSAGTLVDLEAVAYESHRFVGWTGDVGALANPNAASTTITMKSDYSITANFVAQYDLSLSSTVGGSVTTPGEGMFTYDQGAVVSLMATRATGYGFAGWTGDVDTVGDAAALATTITMNADYSIAANFEAEEPVYFADTNLEAAIREAIGIPVRTLYPSDLEGLASLDASERGVSDLTGLQHCIGLTGLRLGGNKISDILPLEGLANLAWLDLGRNQISDIKSLEGLTSLTQLNLWGNQISDISPLGGLSELRVLALGDNQIRNISSLEGLTALWLLRVEDNQISDLSALAGLSKLLDLYLRGNQISDVSPLEGLTGLLLLRAENNQIRDISPLGGLSNLTRLYLSSNQIGDISPLQGLTSLRTIVLSDNQITDISPLVDNVGLGEGDYVNLRENPLSEQSINEYVPALQARGVTIRY